MTDLEEEILFQLIQCASQDRLTLIAKVSENIKTFIPLGFFHQTLLKLEARGMVQVDLIGIKKIYTITDTGKTALLRDWEFYRELERHEG